LKSFDNLNPTLKQANTLNFHVSTLVGEILTV